MICMNAAQQTSGVHYFINKQLKTFYLTADLIIAHAHISQNQF